MAPKVGDRYNGREVLQGNATGRPSIDASDIVSEISSKSGGFRARLATALKPKSSPKPRNRLTKRQDPNASFPVSRPNTQGAVSYNQRGQASGKQKTTMLDKQTGERIDHTTMLHSLGLHESSDSLPGDLKPVVSKALSDHNMRMLGTLPPKIWSRIAGYLDLYEASSLAFSCKLLRSRIGEKPWHLLNYPENRRERIRFLVQMDSRLPNHLLCSVCGRYHLRTQRGQETLKPTNILNPLYRCPKASDQLQKPPRTRLAPGRTLPFTFVQLATRAVRYSPHYGISCDSLDRRWKQPDSDWLHQTRYHVSNGHLLVRMVSQSFAPPGLPPRGQRLLLYWREDWTPHFSVCAHWRDGELMSVCKCALSHIPKPLDTAGPMGAARSIATRRHRPNPMVVLCPHCQVMRRCPKCPTEYLVQVKLVEDNSDPSQLFKYAIVVTRWSDLGDGTSPWNPEWAACNGGKDLDSFKTIGKRAISGIFESHFTGETIPGQRILSLNPKNEDKGEAGNNWY